MAIQVSGTEVISNARNLNNIAAVDTTTKTSLQTSLFSLITGPVTATADNDGTKSSGTYTPSTTGGNFKRIVNDGAFTLAAPTDSGDYTMILQITNGSTPGAITIANFSKDGGDTFSTTAGEDFLVYITKVNGFTFCNVAALQ